MRARSSRRPLVSDFQSLYGTDSVSLLMVGALVMSVGCHFFYPGNSRVVLMTVGKEEAPRTLGRLRSVSSFSAVVGTVVVWLFVDGLGFWAGTMAQTINHVAALVVPVLGGILWARVAPSATFLVGVVIMLVSLVLVQFISAKPVPASAGVSVE